MSSGFDAGPAISAIDSMRTLLPTTDSARAARETPRAWRRVPRDLARVNNLGHAQHVIGDVRRPARRE